MLVLDKTGRIQKFSSAGQFEEVAAKIDDYLGNGFTTKGDEAVIACSGIVVDQVEMKLYNIFGLIHSSRKEKRSAMIGLRQFAWMGPVGQQP